MKPPTEALVKKIIEDAEREAEGILRQAKEVEEGTINRRVEEARRKGAREAKDIISKAEEEASRIIEVAVANARISANWAFLTEKRRIMDEVFEEAKRRVKGINKTGSYPKILHALIREGALAANGGSLEVLLREEDRDIMIDLDSIAGEVEDVTGNETVLRISKLSADILGGAIVRSLDGKITVDCSLEAMLERKRKLLEPKISQVLFG